MMGLFLFQQIVSEVIVMEKKIAYERMGKFGKPEYLIPLKCLPLVQKKESEKAYCC